MTSHTNGYKGYGEGCTGPHESDNNYQILDNTTAWITINLKESHYISKIKFDPKFRPSRHEDRKLSIKFPDEEDAREFFVGKNIGEVGSASIDIRKPLKWTKSIEISGITSKTFEDNTSRFGYNKIELFTCVGKYSRIPILFKSLESYVDRKYNSKSNS